jgi:hypothetical protein
LSQRKETGIFHEMPVFHYCLLQTMPTFGECAPRPMSRARGALFSFPRLLITMNFWSLPIPLNPTPIGTFTVITAVLSEFFPAV